MNPWALLIIGLGVIAIIAGLQGTQGVLWYSL